jgi:hypothetical protein
LGEGEAILRCKLIGFCREHLSTNGERRKKLKKKAFPIVILSIVLVILLVVHIQSVFGAVIHIYPCKFAISKNAEIPAPPDCCISRVDILYPGTPEPGIFTNVTIFWPFTNYETDGETYIHIYADKPPSLADMLVVTFKTILDWGAVGEPTPFTYVEYDAFGVPFKSGTIYNVEAVGGIVIPVDKLSLLAPYIGLSSTILVATVATAVYVKRVKRRKEKQ